MKTFLDSLRSHTKTMLLYGRLNDSFISADMIVRDFEAHLIMLLKSRGYKHVIFYGSEGNRGGYCLDPESARFFFSGNAGISMPNPREFDIDGANQASNVEAPAECPAEPMTQQGVERPHRGTVMDALKRGRRTGAYRPGNRPGRMEPSSAAETSAYTPAQTAPETSDRRIVYALRSWTLVEFFSSIQQRMLDPNSHMAVVFYNIINTDLGQHPALVDAIRHTWEQSPADNICLMLAQGAGESSFDLSTALRHARLFDKFAMDNRGEVRMKASTTFQIGSPERDEIRHLLVRLCVMGTERGHRALVQYRSIDKLADEIIYCTRVGRTEGEYASLRDIRDMLTLYIDRHSVEGNRVRLDIETVDNIWQVHRMDEKPALECLNRPGWEEPYRVISELVNRSLRMQREELKQRSAPEHCTQRFSAERSSAVGNNMDIPNFVLMGNPGTGKSEIARQIGRLLHELGFLNVGNTHEISPANMIDQYQGGPERKTLEACNAAEGGVLVIDEAESIATGNSGEKPLANGKKMVETLNYALTDPRRHFSLVLAGYQDEMDGVFKLDRGFESRFEGRFIQIDDFKPPLLKSIFLDNLHARGVSIDSTLLAPIPDTLETTPLDCMMERLYHQRNRRTFANAREMETLAKRVCDRLEPTETRVCRRHFYPEMTDEWFEPLNMDNSISAILRDFESRLVGMQNIRQMLIDHSREMSEALALGTPPDSLNLRGLMLVGNPGTGKTEVAKLLSRMYFGLGLLGTDEPLVVNARNLGSHYVNATGEKMLEWVKEAQDRKALLFIDEAHQLAQHGMQEAFRALMAPLTDREHPFQLVMAVYPHEERVLTEVDPGAISRFERIELQDYTGPELYQILLKMIEKQGCSLDVGMDEKLQQVCEYTYVTRTSKTGNGRAMERLLEDMNKRRRARCEEAVVAYGTPQSLCFKLEDIPVEVMQRLPEKDKSAEAVCEEILEEINRTCVGMEEIKAYIVDLAARVAEIEARGGHSAMIPVPAIVLSGNPGAGKTLAASLIAKAMFRLHLISSQEIQVCSGQSLMGMHMNESGQLAQAAIKRAWEGNALLFVDEAHQLANAHVNGSESIQAFMQPLTAEGRRPRVVFAVYKSRENAFMRLDPGMPQRMVILHLPDFNGQQLMDIFVKKAEQDGWIVEEPAKRILLEHCRKLYSARSEDSGNGRQMERLLGDVIAQHRRRCRAANIAAVDTEYWAIVEADIPESISRTASINNRDEEIQRLHAIKVRMHEERVGNEEVMRLMDRHVDHMIYNLRYPSRSQDVEPGHYFFVGRAGTGKTTSAEFMARYMHEIGIVNSGELYKTTATDLIGQYLGETGNKTREVLMAGRGHVMLIDEAYALTDQEGHATAYKDDAITEIVSFLDDEQLRRVTCVVFAGYKDAMDLLYRRNEGLKSRVKPVFFPDFTLEQCLRIFEAMAKKASYDIDVEARIRIEGCLNMLMKRPGFSNGRTVRKLCSAICDHAMNRTLENGYPEDDPRVFTLLSEDVPTDVEVLRVVNL